MDTEIRFEALNEGVGLTEPQSKMDSHYADLDEDLLITTYSKDIFFNLDLSGDNYDQLIRRLEKPVLESLENQETFYPPRRKKVLNQPSLTQKKLVTLNEQKNLSKEKDWHPLGVLLWDYGFSLGVFLIGAPLFAGLFQWSFSSSDFVLLGLSYGLFHQFYAILCRSLLGSTLGEERYNLGWNEASVLRFVARGILVIATGFILIPLLSLIFKKDLFREYTGLRLRYNT